MSTDNQQQQQHGNQNSGVGSFFGSLFNLAFLAIVAVAFAYFFNVYENDSGKFPFVKIERVKGDARATIKNLNEEIAELEDDKFELDRKIGELQREVNYLEENFNSRIDEERTNIKQRFESEYRDRFNLQEDTIAEREKTIDYYKDLLNRAEKRSKDQEDKIEELRNLLGN